ncbi:unnamed protein product [Allacma fusca]|uniref:diacylglycerol O-acyltransferase n=1 Tax=Allacma fusca TaxID=39272 RepID=A0A8J2NRF3_9HEXA|nr:unnamed protein product [Allacma fusca]
MDAIFAINSTQYPAGSCLVFALTEGGSFNIQVFRDLFFNRIISFKKDQEFLYQKLQQNWTNFLGFAFWRRDPYFNLRNHIRNFDYQGEMALPSPCNQADIVKLAGQFQDLKWLGNQSPWEILLIPDYLSSKLEKHSVVIFRLHHILLDGYSFISLIRQLFQLPCEIPKCKLISDAQLSKFECLALPLQIFYEIADYSVEIFSLRRFNFNCREGSSVCAVTEPMSIEFIKFIKNKFGVSFSTVIHAALAGAIQKALKDINEDVPESLNFAFPIPKANHPDGLINDVYARNSHNYINWK